MRGSTAPRSAAPAVGAVAAQRRRCRGSLVVCLSAVFFQLGLGDEMPEMPNETSCPECAFETWECPHGCDSLGAHFMQYFDFTHQWGTCWDEFPADGNVMAYELDTNCKFRDEAVGCESMEARGFRGVTMLENCTKTSGIDLAHETCSWRCPRGRPIAHCEWSFDLGMQYQAEHGAIEECWVKPLCIGSYRIEVSIVCRPSEFLKSHYEMSSLVDRLQVYTNRTQNISISLVVDILSATDKNIADFEALDIESLPHPNLQALRDEFITTSALLVVSKRQVEGHGLTTFEQGQEESLLELVNRYVLKVDAIVRLLNEKLQGDRPRHEEHTHDHRHEDSSSFVWVIILLGIMLVALSIAVAVLFSKLKSSKGARRYGSPVNVVENPVPGSAEGAEGENAVVVGRPVNGAGAGAAAGTPREPDGKRQEAGSGKPAESA